jgi:hypothetical protein
MLNACILNACILNAYIQTQWQTPNASETRVNACKRKEQMTELATFVLLSDHAQLLTKEPVIRQFGNVV